MRVISSLSQIIFLRCVKECVRFVLGEFCCVHYFLLEKIIPPFDGTLQTQRRKGEENYESNIERRLCERI